MRMFACILDADGRGIPEGYRRSCEVPPRANGLTFQWWTVPGFALLTASDDPQQAIPRAQYASWVIVGEGRLDDRASLVRELGGLGTDCTDIELLLRLIIRDGVSSLGQVLGDFAVVAWNHHTRTGVAASDALGVQALYWTESAGRVAFASRAEALAFSGTYDLQYMARLMSLDEISRDLTVYTGVRAFPPGSTATIHAGRSACHQYWRPDEYGVESAWTNDEHTAIATCRQLIVDSLRLRVVGRGTTWAQLSGGLDSSTVVSTVQWLAERAEIGDGLGGTVTFVDRQGSESDERAYSNAVVERWHVRNELIVDPPTWYDGVSAPPRLDQPNLGLICYPRDRRLGAIVRGAGGRVLLTGYGGDQLFTGNMLFFADMVARGHVWSAVKEMTRRAAIGRVSFWALAYRNALLPLLPRPMQRRLLREAGGARPQPWLEPAAVRKFGLAGGYTALDEYGGSIGDKYHHVVRSQIATLARPSEGSLLADSIELRHPMIYRPLVEFTLRLPPMLRARPHAHRWVLREAMRGILPERVRTRVGKPTTGEVLGWSLATQYKSLQPLLEEPLVAALGLVNPTKLRTAFHAAVSSSADNSLHAPVMAVLATEMWLRLRCGQSPVQHCGTCGN